MQESNFKILTLKKENLKFSSAHFLIYDEFRAERLHGHNYKVSLAIKIPWDSFSKIGYSVDFSILKKIVKAQLDLWDEYILLPANNKEMKITIQGNSLDLRFRDRHYVFPAEEVVLLPIVNTSVELLSEVICNELWSKFKDLGIIALKIQVEETSGQSATTASGNWEQK